MSAFFNNTTQAAMDGNVKDTPPVVFVPLKEDRPRWESSRQRNCADQAANRSPQDRRPGGFRPLARLRPARNAGCDGSARGIALRRAARAKATAARCMFSLAGKTQEANLGEGVTWDAGHVAAESVSAAARRHAGSRRGRRFRQQPAVFLRRLGKNFESRTPPARSSRGWTIRTHYRGWDLWLEDGRFGSHIINRWQDDALKVVSQEATRSRPVAARLRHLRRLEQGGRREALPQRRIAGRHQRRGQRLEIDDPHESALQDRPAAMRPRGSTIC